MRKYLFLGVIFIILIVGSMAVWNFGRNEYYWGTSDNVRILLSDPVAKADFKDMTLVATEQTPHIGLASKTPQAEVTYWYRSNGLNTLETVEYAVKIAERNGWHKKPLTGDETSWVGEKNRPDNKYDMTIIIAFETQDGVNPDHLGKLRVSLYN